MSSEHPIRILMVDDHPAVRRGLRHLLESNQDLRIIGEAADAESALRSAAELAPDIVLIDVHLGRDNGFDTARLLRQVTPRAHIIMLTSGSLGEALACADGAFTCLLKADADEHLIPAIRSAFL